MPPRITFAIPYFSNRDYLAQAIESVQAQSVSDWDLVVVDDCGPEPADDLIQALADPRITYVRNQVNLGLSGNWNECVRRATAPQVTLLHGDDRLLPRYAERVLAVARSRPDVAAVFTDVRVIGPAGQPTSTLADRVKRLLPRPRGDHDLHGDAATAGLLRGNYVVCPTLSLRVDAVGRSPFDTRWRFVPDWDLTTRLLMDGQTLHGLREPLLEYRRHGASQTSLLTEDASRFVEELELLRLAAARARALGWSASESTARRRLSVRGHLVQKAAVDLLTARPRAALEKGRVLRLDLRGSQRVRAHDPDPQ